MQKKNKNLFLPLLVISLLIVALVLPKTNTLQAATSPDLGTAATYSILAGSEVTNTGATTISGDVGISPGIGAAPHYTGFGTVTLGGVIHDADAAATIAQADRNTAYTALASQTCDTTYVGAFKELAGESLAPGVYCADSFHLTGGTLTLNGAASDVWVFKSSSDLIISGGVAAQVVFVGGGQACNVWWRVVSSATFDANSTLVGNILADTSITFAAGANLNGRALARTAAVTMDGNTISGPTCTTPTPPAPTGNNTITVIKQVINDNGGTAVFNDFPLFINGNPVTSGESLALIPGFYTITETNLPGYTRTFSGHCNAAGIINHGGINTHNDVCTVINDDIGAPPIPPIPPLIDVVKAPSPLALPLGPGLVTYTYTVKNIGTVPMTDVTLVGDTCSPIILNSGDTNGDSILALNETWIYRCSTTLANTHTNTVVATGHANGLTAVDVASSTVIVGSPIIPPLIHVTKIPSPLALTTGAGQVTYRYTVTNPGTVALSDVNITDDKCTGLPGRVIGHPGDLNQNNLLEPNETWSFTCQTNLTNTTTNTAIASGTANGLTATDFAIATVVVAKPVPKLPNAGLPTNEQTNTPWNIIALVGVMLLASGSLMLALRKRTI